MNDMTSNKPYLLRATYEWLVDNECTPYLVANVLADGVIVPEGFDKEGQITLNVKPSAVREFQITNKAVEFTARFNGMPMDIVVPIHAAIALFAQENGQGMVFEAEEVEPPEPPEGDEPPKKRPTLSVVK